MSRPPLRRRDIVTGLAFLFAWVIPIAYTAAVGYPGTWMPRNLRDLYSVSCLFDDRHDRQTVFFMEVRQSRHPRWTQLPEKVYFPMEPFGHRSRFDRHMARHLWKTSKSEGRRDLAMWVHQRHRSLFPDESPIAEVRFVAVDLPIDPAHPPSGCFEKPELADVARERRHRIGRPVRTDDG